MEKGAKKAHAKRKTNPNDKTRKPIMIDGVLYASKIDAIRTLFPDLWPNKTSTGYMKLRGLSS